MTDYTHTVLLLIVICQDDLLAELEELEQEELDEKLLNTGEAVPASLPDVPTTDVTRPTKRREEDDEDMAELAAWAS